VVLAFTGRALRLSAFEAAKEADAFDDSYYLPPAPWLPVLSLGYRAALADLLWCRSLVYFGEGVSQRVAVAHVFEYTDAILALDPDLREAYRWVATATLFRPTEITAEEGLRAADYLERATERWPDDGTLHWDLGSMLRFDLAPLTKDPELKRTILERAAPHLDRAARLGAGPPWLALSNASLFEKLGRTQQALKHLREAYAVVSDDAVRAEIEKRIAALQGALGVPASPAGP
jgi:tetratricopeptide (TPR) repeat protein